MLLCCYSTSITNFTERLAQAESTERAVHHHDHFVPSGKHWNSKRMGMRWTAQNRRQTYLHTTLAPSTTSLSSLLISCCSLLSSANFFVVPTKLIFKLNLLYEFYLRITRTKNGGVDAVHSTMEIASPWRMRSMSQNPVLCVRLRTGRLISLYMHTSLDQRCFLCALCTATICPQDLYDSHVQDLYDSHVYNKFASSKRLQIPMAGAGNRRVWKRGLIRLSFFESSRYSNDLVPGAEFFVISSGPNRRWGHDPCSLSYLKLFLSPGRTTQAGGVYGAAGTTQSC